MINLKMRENLNQKIKEEKKEFIFTHKHTQKKIGQPSG